MPRDTNQIGTNSKAPTSADTGGSRKDVTANHSSRLYATDVTVVPSDRVTLLRCVSHSNAAAFLRLGHSASRRAREDFCRFAGVEMQLRLFLRRLLKPST